MAGNVKLALIMLTAAALAGCGTRPSIVESPAQTAPAVVAPQAEPSIVIAAPGARVRAVIVARARARGATIASDTPDGIALQGPLAQTTEALEAQCGPHQEGRMQRIFLQTREEAGGTVVTDRRFVVDGTNICPIQLTPEELPAARNSLEELRKQVLAPPRPAGQPVAPATPRT